VQRLLCFKSSRIHLAKLISPGPVSDEAHPLLFFPTHEEIIILLQLGGVMCLSEGRHKGHVLHESPPAYSEEPDIQFLLKWIGPTLEDVDGCYEKNCDDNGVLSDLVEELGDFAECSPCAALVFESGGVNDEMFSFVDLSIDYLTSFRFYMRMGN
jgi:hypothetical protein